MASFFVPIPPFFRSPQVPQFPLRRFHRTRAAILLGATVLAPLPALAVPIGSDDFSYSAGAVEGLSGGSGFDYDLFDEEATTTTSDWDSVFGGGGTVAGGRLVTDNNGSKREYNGDIEGEGAPPNDGQNNHERTGAVRGVGRVFYRFTIQRSAGVTWSGASSYEFGAERIFFGVPNGMNGASGVHEFGCEISGGGNTYYSGIPADEAEHTLVAVLDFDNDFVGLWVDPDGADFYNKLGGTNSADAGGDYFGSDWSTAVRLASGAEVAWDDLVVGTSVADVGLVSTNDTDEDEMADDWEAANGLVVGTDDSGLSADADALTNLEEYNLGTDPQEEDTDGDGYWDDAEVTAGTNPLLSWSYPGAIISNTVVGADGFDYPDGSIDGRAGGLFWDLDTTTEGNAFTGHSETVSDWGVIGSAPVISGGKLVTMEGGAKREYNGPGEGAVVGSDEREGRVNDGGDTEAHVVYCKVEMTRTAGATWSGVSSYDFGAERYLFGVPGTANPVSGEREFAIHDLNNDLWGYSGIQPVDGQTYLLVAKLDFDNQLASLYLDPDLGQPEASQTPVATYPHTSGNWSTGIRLASGGSGGTSWDNVRVAHTWSDLLDGPPSAVDDAWTMHHHGKARVKVLANDGGLVDPASVTILTPPSSGTATASEDGTILYEHVSGTPGADSFLYRVESPDGNFADSATATVTFTSAYRFDSDFVSFPDEPPVGELRVEEAFGGISFHAPHGFSTTPADPGKLFITEGDGRVFLIPDMSAPVKMQILDITAQVTHDNNELAMKGIAAHPDWTSNGYIYVTYNTSVGSVRLSRFTCLTTSPYTAGSELILIEQDNDDIYHNIGTCQFGPDGYLYVSFGDEGTQSDGHNNAQHIDRNLWSCVIRIDVDKKPGNLVPNADPGADPYGGGDPGGQSNDADLSIPRVGAGTSGEAHYAIPADNPFVGATSFNGITLDPNQVRTEIVATGLRNPWEFSPEDVDANGSVDELWVADVGRSDREEVNVFNFGDNGGWSWREGLAAGIRSGENLNGAPESAAALVDPIWDYTHGGGPFEGSSVTGGFIYRGTAIPQLTGKYVFADYVSGNIWSLDNSGAAPVVERLAGEQAIVSLLEDPLSGDILLLDRGNVGGAPGMGSVKRLTIGTDDTTLPPTLSDTGFFADLTELSPNPGGQPYAPKLRFWSDHAEKSRWFILKDTVSTVGYSPDDSWSYPIGMVWVKHFDYPTDWETFTRIIDGGAFTDRRPVAGSPRRRLETRFLIRNTTGAYGLSYRWNSINSGTQDEAALVDDDGESVDIDITLDGSPTSVTWEIPSRTNCITCHTPQAGHALSFNTRQLNTGGTIAGLGGNQLNVLDITGYLTGFSGDPAALPRHVRPDETAFTLDERVRSYLDVNCAYCHRAGGTGGGNWDGRAHLSLLDTGMVNGTPVDPPLQAGDRLIVAEDVDRSIIFSRMAEANGYSRMPALATTVVDLEGAELLAAWINQEVPPYSSYNDWRLAMFGDDISPEGEPGSNEDGDRFANSTEWKLGGDPTQRDEPLTIVAEVNRDLGVFRFSHSRLRAYSLAEISVEYEMSEDLANWTTVSVTELSAVPVPGNSAYEIVTVEFPAGAIIGKRRVFVRAKTSL